MISFLSKIFNHKPTHNLPLNRSCKTTTKPIKPTSYSPIDETDLVVKSMFERGITRNPENPLNIHSIGIFYTKNGSSSPKQPFSKHYFNKDGREIAYYNSLMNSGMVFSKPREWSLSNLNTLEITTDLYKHDLKILKSFRPTKLGL